MRRKRSSAATSKHSIRQRTWPRPSRSNLEAARELGRVEDEGWRVRKDGSRFWANVVITALRGTDGRLRGFGKVTRDLTARRQAEETERALLREQVARLAAEDAEARLRDSEERYRALSQRLEVILEGVADGIAVQDHNGRLHLPTPQRHEPAASLRALSSWRRAEPRSWPASSCSTSMEIRSIRRNCRASACSAAKGRSA